jgi:hypothetical protein
MTKNRQDKAAGKFPSFTPKPKPTDTSLQVYIISNGVQIDKDGKINGGSQNIKDINKGSAMFTVNPSGSFGTIHKI